jgi:fermentation-respiration switch protein FrsA (DUF1100 family)
MQPRNRTALTVFALFYLCVSTILTLFQEQFVYRPSAQDFSNCPALATATAVTHNGTRLYVHIASTSPVAVLYHGNAGSACDRAFYTDIFAEAGYGFILVEYAGYSNDLEQPSHDLIKNDVRNVISYLSHVPSRPVVVIGESIGTGAAAYHTQLAPPSGLVLLSPFTDLAAVASNRFWFYPTYYLVDNAFDNRTALRAYTAPTLIIHGTEDTIIPYRLGKDLFDSLTGPKELSTITGAGHNDLFIYEQTYTALKHFLTNFHVTRAQP